MNAVDRDILKLYNESVKEKAIKRKNWSGKNVLYITENE